MAQFPKLMHQNMTAQKRIMEQTTEAMPPIQETIAASAEKPPAIDLDVETFSRETEN